MKKYYLPNAIGARKTWLNNFSNRLVANSTKLGLTTVETDPVVADAAYFGITVDEVDALAPYTVSGTTYRDVLWGGAEAVIGEFPVAPVMGAHVVVLAGISHRLSRMVGNLKNNPALTDSIAEELGIVGTDIIYDFSAVKGDTKGSTKNGHAYLSWTHQGTDSAHIKCDYGDGKGYVFVGTISATRFLDPTTPAVGVTVGYKYIIRYIVGDEEVGVWSDPVTIAVTGMPPTI